MDSLLFAGEEVTPDAGGKVVVLVCTRPLVSALPEDRPVVYLDSSPIETVVERVETPEGRLGVVPIGVVISAFVSLSVFLTGDGATGVIGGRGGVLGGNDMGVPTGKVSGPGGGIGATPDRTPSRAPVMCKSTDKFLGGP